MKNYTAPKAGFTLIELLISVSILTILVGITIPSFSTFATGQSLLQAQAQVKSGIRDVQNKAISGVEAEAISKDGPGSYWFFRSVDGQNYFQLGRSSVASLAYCQNPALMTVTEVSPPLNGGAKFVGSGKGEASCIFYRMFSAEESDFNLKNRRVQLTLGGVCKSIQVNSSGLVKGHTTCL